MRILAPLQPKGPAAPIAANAGGQLIYAIGDIHGCYDQLRTLLKRIADDAGADAAERKPSLIFCGDYVDRGPASAQVVEALCWIKRHGPFATYFLKGNHEQVMLDYIADPGPVRSWMRFGGADTLRSYGIAPPDADDPIEAHVMARDDLLERMPVAHLRFLEQLELMIGAGDYAFVHAGVRPGVALADQSPEDLLWIREGFIDEDRKYERIIVHGHSWVNERPTVLPHRIGVDTGVYQTGVLTAARIEDDGVTFLSAR